MGFNSNGYEHKMIEQMLSEPFTLLKTNFSKFCKLDNKTWEIVLEIFTPKTIKAKELFTMEGDKSDKFGFVYSGHLRMFNSYENGNELTKYFIRPSDFFVGTINCDEQNLVSIQAITDCEILVADYKKLDSLAKTEKVIYEFKTNLISKFVKIKQKRENNYLNMDATDRYNIFLEDYPNLLNVIPHYYIASYLGISSTQLSRIRKKISSE